VSADPPATANFRWFGRLAVAVALLAVICAAIGFRFVFLAGCAGDLKVGLGDPLEALRLEEIAMQWLVGATVLAGLAIAAGIVSLFHHSILAALLEAMVPAALVGIIFWFVAWDVQVFGHRSCGVWNGI
jgi:hypothetical protein